LKGFDPYPILESRIRTGVYPPGTWLATERALAEEFGVHRNVIRRAVTRLGDAGYLERRAGHRPIVRLPNGEGVAPRTIALVMGNEPLFHAFQPILRGCEREAKAEGFRLVYMDTFAYGSEEGARREAEALESLQCNPVAGVVLWAQEVEATAPHARRLMEAGTPIVSIDRPLPGCPTDFVGVDNEQAACVAVEHLLHTGRRRIMHITHIGQESRVRDRAAGYARALRARGIPLEQHRVVHLGPHYVEGSEIDHLAADLARDPGAVDAIFAVNDLVAWRLVESLRRAGLRVPEDIAVVGFDNLEAPTFHKPFLTTIRQPFEDIGRHAAAMLMRRIQAPGMPLRHVLLGTSLIVRGSTTPAPVASPEPTRRAELRGGKAAGWA